ncbi:MAG TPA: hypothetical protein PLF59_08130 [Cyclobacteriaceae bacterium]|nr:hypothetical protein [Cyclobacteriaceae bacterium]
MDFQYFKGLYKNDRDYDQRTFDLQMFQRVLNGTLYDCLNYPFFQTAASSPTEVVPLSKRRPSVRTRLCKVVVDQTVSLLFGEGRFPTIACKDDLTTKEMLDEIVAASNLNLVMNDAAIKGSIGSVAIIVKLINGRFFFEAYCTEYLTPYFQADNPEELEMVRQKCKKDGKELIKMGYEDIDPKEKYWWQREWDLEEEKYYQPWKVSDEQKQRDFQPTLDVKRTIKHNLGFVPMVWIINLPGGENGIDGLCTFEAGIDTNIERDYQLSQGGRGLKYSSEPLLMIKDPSLDMQGDISLSEGNVIQVGENGDAKHIEIQGTAIEGVLNYDARLREVILESIHGNRSNPDKLHTVQSGKGAEMFYQPLIWVADKLRITYGECGFLKILNMIVKCNARFEIFYEVGGKLTPVPKNTLKIGAKLSLQWGDWFSSTRADRLQEAQTLTTLTGGKPLMTQETAINSLSAEYDIVDTAKEVAELKSLADEEARNNHVSAPENKPNLEE